MIFKTFINDLRNVQSIINRISNVEVWANGATGLLNANSLNSLKTAISGLSKEQALLVLSTKNLSKAQTEQVLSAAGLLNVEKQLTTAQLSERLAKELNSKADAEALLINSGLITQKELEKNATIKVTAAKINEAVANGTLSASDAGVIAGALGITGVNTGATISFDLLTASIWANIKALGAWLVTNPIGWAILGGTAIFGLVKAYDALTDSVEEVKERTDALLETYNSAISEANSNAQTIESLASRYEKLSKGVNNLGENVSLTADEYSEYNDIVNQIADMFPTMITGYTDEGNAILSLKGNVEELRDAYKEAQKEAYNLLIVSGKDSDGNDIITNYQNQVHGNESWLSKQSSYIDGEAGAKDAIEIITKLTGTLTPDEFRETYNQLYEEYKNIWNSDKIQEALKSSGFEELTHAPKWSEITVEDLAKVKYSAQATIQTYNAEIDSQLKNMQTLANAYLMTNSDYEKLDEQSKTAASLLVNSINENIANKFSSKEDVGAYVGKLVDSISDNKEVQDALKELFTMDTSDMSVDEVKTAVDSYTTTIATAIEEDTIELKARLGFDDSDTQPLINNVKEKLQDDFDNKVGELTLEELHIAAEQVEVPDGTLLSWDELIAKIKEVQDSTSNIENPISSFQEAFDSLDTTEDDSLKSLKDDLLSLAEAGQLTLEKFTNTTGSDSFLAQLGIEENDTQKINNLISQINQLKSSADQLSSMKKGISGLSENLYNREKEPGVAISADTLAGMDDALKEQGKEWDRYVTVLGDASSSMGDVQKATDELATAYVNSNNFLANLTEANKGYYVSQLDAMGVANSAEIVESRLSSQREVSEYKAQALSIATRALSQESANSTNTLYEQSNALLQEANMSDIAKASLADLVAQQRIFSEDTLNVNDKIASLSALASAYLGTAAQASFLNKVQGGLNSNYRISAEEAWDQTVKDFTSIGTSTIKMSPITTSPKGSGGGGGGGGSSKTPAQETKKDFSETFDWIERRIKKFQRAFDKWLKQAETAVTSGFINKYYKKAFSSAKSQLSIYGKAYNRYMAEANAIGLDEKYAKKVRNGTIDLEEIRAHGTEEEVKKYEELAEKIKKYQDYYDKAQDSMNSFAETAEKLYNLPLDKAAKKVDLFSNNIDLLGKKLDNAVKLKTKNDFIDKQTKEEKKTLNAYTTARNDSRKQLNSAKKELRKKKNLNDDDGITKKERAKIKTAAKKNKEVNLALFTENSAGYKAAIKYNEALKANKKAINDAAAAQQDYNRWLVEASKLKFDNIADYYDKKIQMLNYDMDSLDRKVSEIEAKGKKVNKSYYESQKTVNNKILNQYKAEKEALEKNLKNIKKGTEEWYDAKDQIEQVKTAISDCTKETYDLNNAINQLHFDLFNDISEGISRIIKEQEFLRGLYAHEKNVDVKTGNFTDAGFANLGSLSASYYASKENAERDFAMLKDLQNVKKKGKQKNGSYKLGDWEFNSLDDLQKKIDETYTKWQDDIKETYNLESSIADGMKEKYQAELDMLQELINSKKEALNAEKDLHNYQRTLDEKTKNIATIQKQIAAYSGDTSQEGLAKLQKLQKELSDKEDDLRETEYDRYISDQQDMLDKLYTEYEELISKKLEDFMGLVKEGLQIANNNTLLISSYLKQVANENGYTQETKDLFMLLGADIKDGVLNSISNIVSNKESTSGTKEETKNNGNTSSKSSKNSKSSTINTPNIHKNKTVKKQDYRNTAESFIRTHVNKASKKKSEYSDINKVIYENKGGLYKGKGKVLSSNELKTLARKLLVEYDGDKSKKGALYKKLKSLKIPGFKKGGVVSIDDIEKQVRDNGDDGIVSIKNGEGILTKPETEAVQKLADHAEKQDEADKSVMINGVECIPVPIEDSLKNLIARSHTGMDVPNVDIVNAIKNVTPDLSNMIKSSIPNVQPNNNMDSTTNINLGGIIMNGVNDPKEFSKNLIYSIQKYPKVQKAVCSVSTNIIAGNGKISVNNIKQ